MKKARDPAQMRGAVDARTFTTRELSVLLDCSETWVRGIIAGKPVSDELARRFARLVRRTTGSLFADVVSTSEQGDAQREAVA